MAVSDFIPAGRTSLIRKGKMALQVQTEYACRPMPRITTTILREGQVLQKIERNLANPIASLEEKDRLELQIRRQHSEVITIINTTGKPLRYIPKESVAVSKPDSRLRTTGDQLAAIPGVARVYQLDNQGNFQPSETSNEFKQTFGSVFKKLQNLLTVFMEVPGVGITRERGVCEVECNVLYLASAGSECYIVYVEYPKRSINYEQAISAVLTSHN